MSKLSRHLAKPVELKITNAQGETDIFYIKPLPFEYMPEYYEFLQVITKFKNTVSNEGETNEPSEEKAIELLNLLDKKDLEKIRFIIRKTLEISLPEEKQEEREEFAFRYMFQIMNKVMEVNNYESNIKG